MKNICLQIPDRLHSDSRLVLATVVTTRGSTPQKPGSSALFDTDGLFAGTVGGGIVEGKVQKLAAEVIGSNYSGLHHFDLANDISKTEEAICGGQISVLVDAGLRDSLPVFDLMKKSLGRRVPGILITSVTESGKSPVAIARFWMSEDSRPSLPSEIIEKIEPEFRKLVSGNNPSGFSTIEKTVEGEETSTHFFMQPFFPPDLLLIAGAGHIGRALAHLGSMLDFEVTVIDDRTEYANSTNIPEADHIEVRSIGEAMNDHARGESTYVVIVTRGHKDDAAALKPCFGRELAYTGMIGSRSKIAAMKLEFIRNGWATAEQWDQLHAPIGLEIKSQTVEEIAISIAAELIMVRNGKRV